MRKIRYIPKPFESLGNSNDTSANIYMSMIMNDKWQSLTKNQQLLYLYCKAQYYAEKHKPIPKLKKLNEDEQCRCFTMNKNKWCNLYKLYSDGGQSRFISDMKALINNGFIDLIENGKLTRTKNIYMLSDKWRN